MSRPADFNWSAFYYADALAALQRLKRTTWPEHTEDDPADPVNRLYQAFAYLSHLQAVRLDHAAREVYLGSAQLRPPFVALAALAGYELAPATPAETWLVATLTGPLAGSETLVRAGSIFSTRSTPAVLFESDTGADLVAGPTGAPRALAVSAAGVVTGLDGALPLELWGGAPTVGDALYLGGDPVLCPDRVEIEIDAAGDAAPIRWEYRDDRSGEPDEVEDLGASIRLQVDEVVGSDQGSAAGLPVVVTCLRTGATESAEVVWDGARNTITTSDALGQAVISTRPADYLIETEWVELPDLEDGTEADGVGSLGQSGVVSWSLPFSDEHRWIPSDPEGSGSEGYWLRARWVGTSTGAPTLGAVAEASRTAWAVSWDVRQGRTVQDKLGASDATAGQSYALPRSPLLELVGVTVDGEAWARVDSFLASTANDRHYTAREDLDGTWRITFGNGTAGRVPALSAEIVATYRIGGAESGNVGAGAINQDRSSNARIRGVTNPRAATGWTAQEGTTEASRDALRDLIPAAMRAQERAVTPEDVETLAVAFRTADGSQVAIRALALEEGAGPKTVDLVVVGPGGTAPTAEDLAELDEHLNGTERGLQRVGGVMLSNHRAEARAYTPRAVDVTATIRVLDAYVTDDTADDVANALRATLRPNATRQARQADGTWADSGEWLWEWGQTFDPGVLMAAIYTATSGIVGIDLGDLVAFELGADELPTAGTVTISIVSV